MIVCGIDPDTRATGVAFLTTYPPNRPIITLGVLIAEGKTAYDRRVPMTKSIRGEFRELNFDVLAIEWQHIRPRGERRPNDIMAVQAVAGMVLQAVLADRIFLPLPSEWRGTIKKEIVQARILKEAGLTIDSPDFDDIPKRYRTHAIDALGLALWAAKQT